MAWLRLVVVLAFGRGPIQGAIQWLAWRMQAVIQGRARGLFNRFSYLPSLSSFSIGLCESHACSHFVPYLYTKVIHCP
jgi:hypothetical protein